LGRSRAQKNLGGVDNGVIEMARDSLFELVQEFTNTNGHVDASASLFALVVKSKDELAAFESDVIVCFGANATLCPVLYRT
jgi:hypothetical protein